LDLCDPFTGPVFTCAEDQTFCDNYFVWTADNGNEDFYFVNVDAPIGAFTGSLTAVGTVNQGLSNEVSFTLSLSVVDPCEARTTITLFSEGLDWDSLPWTTDDLTYAIVPTADDDVTSTTNPPGADCGAYTIIFSLSDSDGNPPPETATITGSDYSFGINFNQDVDAAGDWNLNVLIYHTDYPNFGIGGTNAFATYDFAFTARDPCAEDSTTYSIDNSALVSAWTSSVSVFQSQDYFFDIANWVTRTISGPTNTPNCGDIVVTFELNPAGASYLSVVSDTATVDFGSDTSAVATSWSLVAKVQGANYVDPLDPHSFYEFSVTAFDPCDDVDALTVETDYIAGFATTYDLFQGKLDYTWDPNSVVSYDNTFISESFCGDLTVTLATVSGPTDVYTITDTNSYYIFGSDPADGD